MKKLTYTVIFIFCCNSILAQNVGCGQAVAQLQNYAIQVNQIYHNEYWQVIPSIRCPAVNQFNQPYHPQLVQNCRMQMVNNLNQWYGQQCLYVNNLYSQIVKGCVIQPTSYPRLDSRLGPDSSKESSPIDVDQIDELVADVDDTKALKITIPKTASGFKPN
ncbi:hypothetical protein [Siphonobacter sp.]|uniref:hypothetical protein n=1 Tax=Siphonobacter sp. TaxID=1869184 RepID=UPI003B3BBA32